MGKKKKKELTVEDLIEILKKQDPKAIVATSDYNGGDHKLYNPQFSSFSKGVDLDSTDVPVTDGGNFVDNQNKLKQNIFYLGYRS